MLAVDECYAEIYTGDAPPGALEAALEIDETGGKDPFRNLAVFHSLSKRSNAAGLRSGFVAGDPQAGGDDPALAHLWRSADSHRRPESLGGAVARRDASAGHARRGT